MRAVIWKLIRSTKHAMLARLGIDIKLDCVEHMPVDIDKVSQFLFTYAEKYRSAYANAIAEPPYGPGYPPLPVSPYLAAASFEVFIASNGVVINHIGEEPSDHWHIAGGPALKVDYEPTVTPPAVIKFLESNGLVGKPIGIARIVSKKPLPHFIWQGNVRGIARTAERRDPSTGISLKLHEVKSELKEVVAALSFGAYGYVLDVHLPKHDSEIGEPHLLKNFGVFTADQASRRFFTHLEIHGQSDVCAWDKRTSSLRAKHDLRRDLARALSELEKPGSGTLSFGAEPSWIEAYSNRLERLETAIKALRNALQSRSDAVESVFHNLIVQHPLLLDVYGRCESKPYFAYPPGSSSPIGKTALQPDFLVKYPDLSYKLVEIERPSKEVATYQGQPRSEVGQAVFQCAEWKHFIKTHYQQLHSNYPGIQSRCKTAVVMSRTTQSAFKSAEDIADYKGLIMEQFKIDEFYTFDDLYDRARTAYVLLAGLAPGAI